MSPKASAHTEHLLVPVTALCLRGSFLFSGEGPYLKIYSHESSSQLATCKVFVEQAVHGIVVAHDDNDRISLVVYGGRHVRQIMLCFDSTLKSMTRITTGPLQKCSDWIMHMIMAPLEEEKPSDAFNAVAITAHNALIGLTFDFRRNLANLGPSIEAVSMTAATRCMLYTATMAWLSPTILLIASGTAFGEIIVWTCHTSTMPEDRLHKLQIHYSFSAHDGSIFGLDIDISQNGSSASPNRALVASCSDDRTFRLWDVSSLLIDAGSVGQAHKASVDLPEDIPKAVADPAVQKETENRLKASPRQITKAWAHSSRIWHVKFIKAPKLASAGAPCHVITLGEDAAYNIWKLESSDGDTDYSLNSVTDVDTFTGHAGKNIWSFAMGVVDSGFVTVVTGGADGRIVLAKSPVYTSRSNDIATSWTAADLSKLILAREFPSDVTYPDPTLSALIENPKDNIKSYCFISDGQILLTTANGLVFCLGFGKTETLLPQGACISEGSSINQNDRTCNVALISVQPSLSSFSVLAGNSDLGIAFIGDSTGQIFSYINNRKSLFLFANVETKVAALFLHVPTGRSAVPSSWTFHLLVTRMANQVATLIECKCQQTHDDSSLEKVSERKIALPPQFIVTAMACLSLEHNSVVLGSRDGRILRFPIPEAARNERGIGHPANDSFIGKYDHVGQHEDAVTCILWRPNANTEHDDLHSATAARVVHILTTARDSSYAIHKITIDNDNVQAEKLHSKTLPFGPNIEGIADHPNRGDLKFYGFDSKYFVEYSERDCIETLRVECGGAHRVWAYQPREYDTWQDGIFVWTKASRLSSFASHEPKAKIIKHGGHGREIKACALQPEKELTCSSQRLLATGAEDTDIRIFSSSESGAASANRCLSVVKKHNTGIQQLQWSDDGRYLFSCGGCEEFFVWRIQQLRESFVEIGVLFESAMPPSSELPDLRIMDFAVQQWPWNRSGESNEAARDVFTIFMVLSDSTMRHYTWSSVAKSWKLMKTGTYQSCCLTAALYLDASCQVALVGATDGTISLWDLEGHQDEIQKILSTRVHQNAIKDMAVVDTREETSGSKSTCWVFCVGDDNALSVTRLDREHGLLAAVSSTLIVPRAHYAAATALSVLSVNHTPDARTGVRLATAGNDQRVRVWDFSCDASRAGVEGVAVVRACDYASAVADAACMASVGQAARVEADVPGDGNEQRLLVCGVGIEAIAVR